MLFDPSREDTNAQLLDEEDFKGNSKLRKALDDYMGERTVVRAVFKCFDSTEETMHGFKTREAPALKDYKRIFD